MTAKTHLASIPVRGVFTRIRILCATLAIATMFPSSAWAWNDKGHMMVAYLAYQQLTQPVRDRVAILLALNPRFTTWNHLIPAGTSAADRPALLFAIAATWADHIKSDPTFSDDGTQDGNRPDGASSSQNTGYTDKLRHKYWHFIDKPFTRDNTSLPAIPDPNVESRIHLFRSVLSTLGTNQDPLKSYDLVWLLHLVGDVHQPLHGATRVSSAQPDGDQGGNLVTVCPMPPCGSKTSKLHSFWDGLPGPEMDVASAVAAAKLLAPPPTVKAMNLDEHEWVIESFDLAQGEAYRPPVTAGAGPFSLTSKYRSSSRAVMKKQIALAGARLANVLNGELK
jgi:S1/P1 nuclease